MAGLLDLDVGSIVGNVMEKGLKIAERYFPPDMSDAEKAKIKLQIRAVEEREKERAEKYLLEATQALTDRIAQLEGTASDLKSVPVVGPLMLFLRGSQRVAWGFGVLYMDLQVFSGAWKLGQMDAGDQVVDLAGAFWIINLLVLGFLFGERAIKNLMPLFERLLSSKVGK
ncbi:hypothetical protein QQ73_13010 [Candidatus Endoriftia persephone str. Guaymas]|nr:hypothetical protein [Candidatus Endoriftia persephone str. Guaymas]